MNTASLEVSVRKMRNYANVLLLSTKKPCLLSLYFADESLCTLCSFTSGRCGYTTHEVTSNARSSTVEMSHVPPRSYLR